MRTFDRVGYAFVAIGVASLIAYQLAAAFKVIHGDLRHVGGVTMLASIILSSLLLGVGDHRVAPSPRTMIYTAYGFAASFLLPIVFLGIQVRLGWWR